MSYHANCTITLGIFFFFVTKIAMRGWARIQYAVNEPSSSSDESLITPFVKRKRTAEYVKLTNISSELKEVKDSLEKIFTLTSGMSIPVALRNVLCDTFRCSICQTTPMVPPIIFAKCCKCILGCVSTPGIGVNKGKHEPTLYRCRR